MPSAPARSSLSGVREVPITVTPSTSASCAAAVPTPLPIACTSTLSPPRTRACRTMASHAVRNASGIAAASTYVMLSSTAIASAWCTTTYSAWAPPPTSPITRSPRDQYVTPRPTSTISPAYSSPGMSSGQPAGAGYLPARWLRSARLRPAAWTRTRIWPSCGTGVGRSSMESEGRMSARMVRRYTNGPAVAQTAAAQRAADSADHEWSVTDGDCRSSRGRSGRGLQDDPSRPVRGPMGRGWDNETVSDGH